MSPTSGENIKVGDYIGKWELTEKIAKIGENIVISRFVRFELGK